MEYTYNDLFPDEIGIYKIWFAHNPSKIYIGSALKSIKEVKYTYGFKGRWKRHLTTLKANKHINKKIQNLFNKHGIENIRFGIIEICEANIGIEREQYWIDFYDSYNKGLNCTPKANSMLGFKHSSKTKKLFSESKGKIYIDLYEKEILRLYNELNTIREISTKLSISKEPVIKILKKNGIKSRNTHDYHKLRDVYVYDLSGELLSIEDGVTRAARKYKIPHNAVKKNICNSTRKTHNLIFTYASLSQSQILERINKKVVVSEERRRNISRGLLGNNRRGRIKNIYQYDLENKLVKIWKDSKELVIYFDMKNFTRILRVIKGERKKYKNFIWKLQ